MFPARQPHETLFLLLILYPRANREDALEKMRELIMTVAESLVVKEMTQEQAKKQTKM